MSKISVDKVYYSEKENVSNEDREKISYTIREIQSVSDYLRAIESVLSNYYFAGDSSPIKNFENLFNLKENKWKEIISDGIFFRGQSKKYNFIIPSVFRNVNYIKNEEEIIKEAEISYPLEIQKAENQIDKLALMQHYGLPTRILDITTNALVGLYFAVSEINNEDGVVYLFNKRMAKEKLILSSKSTPILVKTALSKLTYKEKRLLDFVLNKVDNKEILVSSLKKINHRILPIIAKVYDNIKTDTGFIPSNIKISDFYGLNFVSPLEIDERIIRQNAMFMIFGLDGIYNANKETLKFIKNDKEIIEKKRELGEVEKNYRKTEEELENEINELNEEERENKEEELKRLSIEHMYKVEKIRKKISELEIKRKNYKFEEEMQRTLDKIITNYMLLYSPESFLPKQEEEWHFIGDDGKKVSSGEVVILLKSKYKKRIKNELEIIGISQRAIYPDMQNKSQYIKEKYL